MQTLKENIQQEYREVVERRVFTGDHTFFLEISTPISAFILFRSFQLFIVSCVFIVTGARPNDEVACSLLIYMINKSFSFFLT